MKTEINCRPWRVLVAADNSKYTADKLCESYRELKLTLNSLLCVLHCHSPYVGLPFWTMR